MYPASSEGLNKETDEAIYFFTTAFEPLSTYSAHQVRSWGCVFPTAEHAFQWKKFSASHPDVAQSILEAGSPEAAKRIASAHKPQVLPAWYDERVAVMEEILTAKAAQHEDVRELLKLSGTRRIIESGPVDAFWGCGPDGSGENWIGKIWMKVRDNLRIKINYD